MDKKTKKEELSYFDIKVQTSIPAVIHYRILASSPEEALQTAKYTQPKNIDYFFARRRDTKATVYAAGTTLIRYIKVLMGSL